MSFKTSLFAFFLLFSAKLSALASCEACNIQLWVDFLENNSPEPKAIVISHLFNSIEPQCQTNVEFSELSNEILFKLFASHPQASLSSLTDLGPQQTAYILAQLAAPLHEGVQALEAKEAVQKITQTELSDIKQKVINALNQMPIAFSLISEEGIWLETEYFLTRTENGIEQKIEITSVPVDWEAINDEQVLVLVLNGNGEMQIIDFSQPQAVKYVNLAIGSVDILEIATFEGGFYFVSAEAEHLAFTTDALWRYEWEKGDYSSVAIPDSLNMKGLTCNQDGSQIAFAHTIPGPEAEYEEIYQLILFDLASQNVQLLDEGFQANAEHFVKEETAGVIHFLDDQNLIYLKSSNGKRNVYQIDLLSHEKSILSSLPYYVLSIALSSKGNIIYRSKDDVLVSLEWASGKLQKQAIPAETSVLGLIYY